MRHLIGVAATVVVLTGLTACGGSTDGNGTPASGASSSSAPFQDLPDPVVTAGISTDGVDPCSVLGDDILRYLDADASRTEQADAGPTCTYTSGGTTIWSLTFAKESLADFAKADGGVNVAIGRASARVVDGGKSCRIAVALTDDSTLQVTWDDQEAGDGCRKTNVVASEAMLRLATGR